MILQQGDVLIEKVEEVKGKKLDHLVLASGEATGHRHEVVVGDATLYEGSEGLYLEVRKEATVVHPEHKPIEIPTGKYRIRKVREYDHFAGETRKVRD